MILYCREPYTHLYTSPDETVRAGRRDSQVLYGERVRVTPDTASRNGLCHIKTERDGYEGWVLRTDFKGEGEGEGKTVVAVLPVTALWAQLYPAPDFKTVPVLRIPCNALVRVLSSGNPAPDHGFLETEDGLYIHHSQIAPLPPGATLEALAKRFAYAPYQYGGRTPDGIDCTGLIQVCLQLLRPEMFCRRDTDMQIEDFPDAPAGAEILPGDLLYFEGHVAIYLGDGQLVHATARTMRCGVEPLAEVESYYRTQSREGRGIIAHKRLPI